MNNNIKQLRVFHIFDIPIKVFLIIYTFFAMYEILEINYSALDLLIFIILIGFLLFLLFKSYLILCPGRYKNGELNSPQTLHTLHLQFLYSNNSPFSYQEKMESSNSPFFFCLCN